MTVFASEYLGLDDEFEKSGVFDSIVDEDSNFFINLVRLKATQITEFKNELYPNMRFDDGIVWNPYKKCELLLLPIDILHELPIAKSWDDIDRVIQENESIRREINEVVSEEWYKWASSQKKYYLKEQIFKNPERCARVIDVYKNSTVPTLKLSSDIDYYVAALFKQMKKTDISFSVEEKEYKTSIQAAEDVLNIFKNWIENNRGWNTILEIESSKREKAVQRLIHLGAKYYIRSNNLDISFEPDAGRGSADFKVSRGNDITVGEIKLSSNGQYLHGYTVQIEEYAEAEGTKQKIFVFVDIGNPGRLKKINEEHKKRFELDENAPILIIIDSTPKVAASTYN